MNHRFTVARPALLFLAMTVFGASLASAQDTRTQSAEVLRFEVISVDGNNLVVRDQNGARELTVPDDFRFTVDGKPLSVHDLKAGMKGTATVTTTTTVRPVYVTEIKKGTVVRQVGTSVHVRTADGVRWFKKAEIDQRGVQIFMNGKPIRVTDLKEGDQLTAMIVSAAPPEVLTEKDVQAALDAPDPAPVAEAAAEPTATPVVATSEEPSVDVPPAEPTAMPLAAPMTEIAAPVEAPADRRWIWIGLVLVAAIVAFLLLRKRPAQS